MSTSFRPFYLVLILTYIKDNQRIKLQVIRKLQDENILIKMLTAGRLILLPKVDHIQMLIKSFTIFELADLW